MDQELADSAAYVSGRHCSQSPGGSTFM